MSETTSLTTERTETGRIRFPGISSRAWEHPADRAALVTLRAVPGLDIALKRLFGLVSERALRLMYLASAVEVGPTQYPRVDRLYRECLSILDAPERYMLFVTQSPVLNAGAVGWDKPFIVLNSATVQSLDDDQLRVVIAHEIGHILSGHVLYKTMLKLLLRVGISVFNISFTTFGLFAVLAALLEWDRKSELSADRASALVAQNPDHVRAMLLRLAGGVGEGASIEAFRDQANRYDDSGNPLDSVVKLLALMRQTHPFPVHRVKELDAWEASGDYGTILLGAYPLRGEDVVETPWAHWAESAGHYADAVKTGTDPVLHWMKGVGHQAGEQAGKVSDWFKKFGKEG